MKPIFDAIIKKFIKNYNDVNSQEVREAYGKLGGTVGIIINSTILLLELSIGLVTNSVAITADAFNNLSDTISSLITIISFKLANKPADENHPFGYGRVEYLTAIIFSGAIFVVGFEFAKSSLDRVLHPAANSFNLVFFLLMLSALPLQIFLNRFYTYIGRKIDSSALKASALESYSDILVLSIVVLSLLVTAFTTFPVDGYAGIIVSLFIIHSGYELARDTLSYILGKAPDKELVIKLKEEVLKYPYIMDIHDLVIHNYGPGRYMTSFHVEVPHDVPSLEIHDIIDKAEKEVGNKLNMYIVMHMDPVKLDDPETLKLKDKIEEIIEPVPQVMSMHDFRVVGDGTEKTLIFDVVAEKKYYKKENINTIKTKICQDVKKINPKYRCIINVEQEFI